MILTFTRDVFLTICAIWLIWGGTETLADAVVRWMR